MSPTPGLNVAIVGGGPAGLAAAEMISGTPEAVAAGVRVTVYDHMPSLGRKFLMAGRGGLNLTHSEPLEHFLTRYGPAGEGDPVLAAVRAFPPQAMVDWAEGLGQEMFIGSSGRMFPKAMKASPLLRAWLRRLDGRGVAFAPRRRWLGWDDGGALLFDAPGGRESVRADAVILAMGGGSWPRLGSDASWVAPLASRGVAVTPLRPANGGFEVAWSPVFRERFAGEPMKGVALTFARRRMRGEFVVTAQGVEGGAIYSLSGPMRDAIAAEGEARLYLDLKPDWKDSMLIERLAERALEHRKESVSTALRKAVGLSPVAIGLMREAAPEGLPVTPPAMAKLIKGVLVRLVATRPLAEAISTAGGVSLDELEPDLMLRRIPGVFVAGEMLDWEAPTGGYLLQASMATGMAAGRGVLRHLQLAR